MKARKRKKSPRNILQWLSFSLCMVIIASLTGYGFSLTLSRDITLDSAPEEPIAMVGVALSNNIGTNIASQESAPVRLPQEVSLVEDSMRQSSFGENFFDEHFHRIDELREVVQIDINQYLRVHPNRGVALDKYIEELQEMTDDAQSALQSVNQLQSFHMQARLGSSETIKNTQSAIEQEYNRRDSQGIMDKLAQLEENKIEDDEHGHIALFAKRIGIEYASLIALSQKKIALLNANKPALSQGITVSLPVGAKITDLQELKIFATEQQ